MEKINSLSQIRVLVEKIDAGVTLEAGEWSSYKTLVHCAKTIKYSMTGYPELKPYFVRVTIGKLVIRKFLKQGHMNHSLTADVPGSPLIDDNGTTESGKKMLLTAIDTFLAYNDVLHPHLLFGKMTKEQYSQYFALHIADHLKR